MIDATFVEVPRQRNTREENAQIKASEIPADWQQSAQKFKLRQKDVDAPKVGNPLPADAGAELTPRWAKKNQENHFSFKNHINADQENKLVQSYAGSVGGTRQPSVRGTAGSDRRVPLKIHSLPKCPTRGRRSATGKSSPCGVVSKARGKFRIPDRNDHCVGFVFSS